MATKKKVDKKEEVKVEEPKGFDINKFETTSFKERTAEVEVPDLAQFFPEGEKPIWIVNGLTANELALTNEAVAANKNIEGIVAAITSELKSDKMKAVTDILGISAGDRVPQDSVKRFSMLVYGSVKPKCPQNIAVKLADAHPITFISLTNKIAQLTGEGKLGE